MKQYYLFIYRVFHNYILGMVYFTGVIWLLLFLEFDRFKRVGCHIVDFIEVFRNNTATRIYKRYIILEHANMFFLSLLITVIK